ncbi:MAG: DUF2630 family protein [Thermoleophilia bacterium]
MSDESISALIERLVAEEHRLLDGDPADDSRHQRLESVRVELDRCWDLLRQRRGREEFGLDPDQASVRGEGTVEDYRQ